MLMHVSIDYSCILTVTDMCNCIVYTQDRQKRLSIANYDKYNYDGSGGSGVDPVTPDPATLPFKEYVAMTTSYIQA